MRGSTTRTIFYGLIASDDGGLFWESQVGCGEGKRNPFFSLSAFSADTNRQSGPISRSRPVARSRHSFDLFFFFFRKRNTTKGDSEDFKCLENVFFTTSLSRCPFHNKEQTMTRSSDFCQLECETRVTETDFTMYEKIQRESKFVNIQLRWTEEILQKMGLMGIYTVPT